MFRYGIAHGYAKRNPAKEITPSDILKSTSKNNYPRIEAKELSTLLKRVEIYHGTPVRLVDRKSREKRFWTLQWQVPYTKLAKDYAIIARIHDNVTGQPVIIIAGILGEGTEAASEVVFKPAYLDEMLKKAPKNWDQLNLEAVIETNVIEGHAGPPTVLAVETWR